MSDSKSKNKPTKKADVKIPTKRRFVITEKQRTVILLVLLVFATGFIYWIQSGIDDNFIETL